MKRALLIISHGSRRADSNAEVAELTNRVREQSDGLRVAHAFLEMAEPTVAQAIDRLAQDGTDQVLVFPHFLAAGAHVTDDIPHEINAARTRHPQISFRILPHLGALSAIPSLILQTVDTQS